MYILIFMVEDEKTKIKNIGVAQYNGRTPKFHKVNPLMKESLPADLQPNVFRVRNENVIGIYELTPAIVYLLKQFYEIRGKAIVKYWAARTRFASEKKLYEDTNKQLQEEVENSITTITSKRSSL